MRRRIVHLGTLFVLVPLVACSSPDSTVEQAPAAPRVALDKYTTVRLDAALDGLSDNQRKMIPLLFEAAHILFLGLTRERDK